MKFNLGSIFRRSGDKLVKAPHIAQTLTRRKGYNAMTEFVREAADDNNAIRLFDGDWASYLPPSGQETPGATRAATGTVPLFTDEKIVWAAQEFGGLQGKRILELGPMEGGHSYLLQKLGAGSVLSMEANRQAFLKCLIVKNMYNLDRVTFLLGDFIEWMKTSSERFDACIASGVLYHMMNPMELISLVSRRTDCVYFWTHYYDEKLVALNPSVAPVMGKKTRVTVDGFSHDLYAHSYKGTLDLTLFLGGLAVGSSWMTRDDILNGLRHFGFNDVRVAFDTPNHPGGPAFSIAARRTPS
jgi:hypothetical protein